MRTLASVHTPLASGNGAVGRATVVPMPQGAPPGGQHGLPRGGGQPGSARHGHHLDAVRARFGRDAQRAEGHVLCCRAREAHAHARDATDQDGVWRGAVEGEQRVARQLEGEGEGHATAVAQLERGAHAGRACVRVGQAQEVRRVETGAVRVHTAVSRVGPEIHGALVHHTEIRGGRVSPAAREQEQERETPSASAHGRGSGHGRLATPRKPSRRAPRTCGAPSAAA
jgi:hypothetical protein